MIEILKSVSKNAGEFLLKNFRKDIKKIKKKREFDFVSEIDIKVEEIIKKNLKKYFPEIPFLGEENIENFKGRAKKYFLCDPLDGTANYLRGIPNFATSISLMEDESPEMAVTYLPFFGDIYYAKKGKGAFKNGKRISVSKRKKTRDCIIATGFPFREKELKENFSKIFLDIFDEIVDLRRMGSACQDLCFVAEGVFDGFFEYGLSPWDIAAGILIVEEAGGRVTDFKGGRDFFKKGDILATNGRIHKKMVSILEKYYRD